MDTTDNTSRSLSVKISYQFPHSNDNKSQPGHSYVLHNRCNKLPMIESSLMTIRYVHKLQAPPQTKYNPINHHRQN